MPRRRRYASAIVPAIGRELANKRRADSGDWPSLGEIASNDLSEPFSRFRDWPVCSLS